MFEFSFYVEHTIDVENKRKKTENDAQNQEAFGNQEIETLTKGIVVFYIVNVVQCTMSMFSVYNFGMK